MSWVIDASVALKWVIPETLSDKADRVRDEPDDLLAPDLLLVEVANALWKKTAARELSAGEADAALDLVRHSGADLRPTPPLIPMALELARRLGHSVYACVYLALAQREHATLVTADQRFLRQLSNRRVGAEVVDLRTFRG